MPSEAQLGPDISDEERVRLFQETRGDHWFAELFRRHKKKVFFACRAFFGNSETAEDVTQETFLHAYQNMDRFREGDFSAWLMRICRNVCIDEWRKRRPEKAATVDLELDDGPAANQVDSASDLRLVTERLRREMGSLVTEQRQCLELKIEGYSYEEIADRTRLPVKAVKSHLQNARRMLWIKLGATLSQLR